MAPLWNDGHRFAGRVAIVTGGGGVLGGVTARALGSEGATVVIGYRTSKAVARQNVAAIEAAGGQATSVQLDVADEASVEHFIADVTTRHKRIDVLINAAGRIDAADAVRFADAQPQDIRSLFDVDVLGTMRMCQAVRPHMVAGGGGAIVNFSGSYGNGINQENLVNSVAVAYCAAKGAIRGFTASLARDFAPSIRVNAVSPGAIAANWDADWDIPAEFVEEAVSMTPLRRLGLPQEIAETALFLASDGGGYVTGQVLQVDGGWVMAG